MNSVSRNLWRLCFLLAGAALFIGGPLHPDGTMAMMLGDPNWLISHVLMTISFTLMAAGLALWSPPVDALRVITWLRLALVATILQTVDMVVHTAGGMWMILAACWPSRTRRSSPRVAA